ncbi:methyltransferase domain-containing protein [Streptomyces sp. NBC_01267]|uniref:methyltransferase domain-containing protein n=1 Tax=Streptomyces sp. NBC_01267 TaxID=2903805 RepID=UPI002E3075B6|nr:methyltransferase domain-containing protein [Streptomyces sp. NBC_01267]
MKTGASIAVLKTDDPAAWQRYADADVPIVTQWDDGQHDGITPGSVATSSASMPSVVFRMLQDLDVKRGSRVLEIGTGTGYNAALLAYRAGSDNIVSVDVDAAVTRSARQALQVFGLPLEVITADGYLGHPERAPYDRVIATAGVRELPFAWIDQARPGAVIVAPWGTVYGNQDAVVRLVVAADKKSASGAFTGPVEFMKLRSQRTADVEHNDYVPAEGVRSAATSSTTVTEAEFLAGGKFSPAQFAIGLRVRDCLHAVSDKRDGARPVWFYGLTDRSWAVVMLVDGQSEARVWQSGSRRLWDEVEAAYRWWEAAGRPGHERFGLTVSAAGQRAWLDSPDVSWEV